jgi:tetratricopeptide (TPR) repeat protein
LDAALESAERIGDPYSRDQAYGSLASRAVDRGETEFADEVVGKITDDSLYALALEQLAIAHARTGAFDQALDVSGELADGAAVLSSIAVLYAEKGDFDNALDVANSVEYPDLKCATLTQMAQRAISKERSSEASEFLGLALESADGIETLKEKADALIGIGNFYRELGENDRSFEILLKVSRLCDGVQELMPDGFASIEALDQTLSQVVQGFASLHHFEEADGVIEGIEDPFQFAVALAGIANEHRLADQPEEASALLVQAVELIDEEKAGDNSGSAMKDAALAQVAIGFAGLGDFDAVVRICSNIQSADQKQVALQEAAIFSVIAGNTDWPFSAGRRLSLPLNVARFYLALADALSENGHIESAGDALAQVRFVASGIENHFERVRVLAQVAVRYSGRPEEGLTRELLLESLELVREMNDSFSKAGALILLARLYGKAGVSVGETERSILEEMTPIE